MWAAQFDLFGPCKTYVPGYERQTRGRNALATDVHVGVFVCPVTRLVNLQVIEGRDAGAVLAGVTRMSCEVGIPKYLLIDDDKAIRKALRDLEVDRGGSSNNLANCGPLLQAFLLNGAQKRLSFVDLSLESLDLFFVFASVIVVVAVFVMIFGFSIFVSSLKLSGISPVQSHQQGNRECLHISLSL